MIIYYTGTGNSRYCAGYLAKELNTGTLDAFNYIRRGIYLGRTMGLCLADARLAAAGDIFGFHGVGLLFRGQTGVFRHDLRHGYRGGGPLQPQALRAEGA